MYTPPADLSPPTYDEADEAVEMALSSLPVLIIDDEFVVAALVLVAALS